MCRRFKSIIFRIIGRGMFVGLASGRELDANIGETEWNNSKRRLEK